eukprot:3813365-Rhodomonas_salina.5
MEKAAEYSDRAVTLLNSVIEEDGDPSLDDMKLLRSAYFWKALNCGSVSGLGGCDKWSCNESMKQAEEALQVCAPFLRPALCSQVLKQPGKKRPRY